MTAARCALATPSPTAALRLCGQQTCLILKQKSPIRQNLLWWQGRPRNGTWRCHRGLGCDAASPPWNLSALCCFALVPCFQRYQQDVDAESNSGHSGSRCSERAGLAPGKAHTCDTCDSARHTVKRLNQLLDRVEAELSQLRERCFVAEERLASVYMGVSDVYEAAGLVWLDSWPLWLRGLSLCGQSAALPEVVVLLSPPSRPICFSPHDPPNHV